MNLRYCSILTTEPRDAFQEKNIPAVDFLQWNKLFQGKIYHAEKLIPTLKDDDFDIIHLDANVKNLDLIKRVRERLGKESRTKLILSFAQSPAYWENELERHHHLKDAILAADFVSATEYSLALYLEELSGKKVYELPYPFAAEKLKHYPSVKKKGIISFVYSEEAINYKFLKLFFSLLGKKIRILTFKKDESNTRIKKLKKYQIKVQECQNEEEFLKSVAESEWIFAPGSSPAYGELVLYAAIARTPVVGSLRLEVMRRCYPFTSFETINHVSCAYFYLYFKFRFGFKKYIKEVAANRIPYYYPDNLAAKFLDFMYLETRDTKFLGAASGLNNQQSKLGRIQRTNPVFVRDIKRIHGPQNIDYKTDECVLVSLVKDGAEYLTTFMNYYLRLGIKHFYFIDNGSTDATLALLKQYPYVTIYKTDLAHKKYEAEIRQTIIEANCRNHWCLSVDIDELFDFPCSDSISLNGFLDYLNTSHFTAVVAYMLDMFPKNLVFSPDLFEADWEKQHCYYDISHIRKGNYYSHVKAFCNYNRLADQNTPYYYGGIRKKVFKKSTNKYLLIKHPLMFIDKNIEAVTNPHYCNKAFIADVNAVIKHYKFLPTFKDKIQKTCKNYDFFANQEYEMYIKTFKKNNSLSMHSESAIKLHSVNDLLHNNFLTISKRYANYVSIHQGNHVSNF